MSAFRRWFDATYRRARKAAEAGDFLTAARLFADADDPQEAGRTFMLAAAREKSPEARLALLGEALQRVTQDGQARLTIAAEHARAVATSLSSRVLASLRSDERDALREAATRLEAAGDAQGALRALEHLGDEDAQAALLERCGEVERLEALLAKRSAVDERHASLLRHLRDAETHLASGARAQARQSLDAAHGLDAQNADVARLRQLLERRWLGASRVTLRIDAQSVDYVGRPSCSVGRDADVCVRGPSVSREHSVLELRDGAWHLRDAGSRNGTLVGGYAIDGAMRVTQELEFSLGESAAIRATPHGENLALLVVRGQDQQRRAYVGVGPHSVSALPVSLSFESGVPVMSPHAGVSILLDGVQLQAPVQLLAEDVIEVEGVRIEACK